MTKRIKSDEEYDTLGKYKNLINGFCDYLDNDELYTILSQKDWDVYN